MHFNLHKIPKTCVSLSAVPSTSKSTGMLITIKIFEVLATMPATRHDFWRLKPKNSLINKTFPHHYYAHQSVLNAYRWVGR